MKSLQLILNELADELGIGSISNSAFTQRRALLKHEFFIELNQKTIVEVMYKDGDFKRYKGMRVLGIDGLGCCSTPQKYVYRKQRKLGKNLEK